MIVAPSVFEAGCCCRAGEKFHPPSRPSLAVVNASSGRSDHICMISVSVVSFPSAQISR